jgi:hypothetical protein
MMKERKHDAGMAELFQEDPAFTAKYLGHVFQEGDQPDQAIAMRHLRAAIAAGLESGPGRSANAVLKRLETKYRKQIDQTNRRSSEAD